ncbi:scarecrow-like protein 32 [Cucumis melo var. makuwa]|uniref:Scarecrow-like protein 32 n=1 Tax=Cucumis melo var. makuwa TaxID=1194695 RepID=A0A5A7SN24_CUCMM|nr:scarecrow-like protein 32 [Cucumis melo var. makuwa]TYK07075.1 scarecrow-like protein 32 [Cucumis melo var. makuwa]
MRAEVRGKTSSVSVHNNSTILNRADNSSVYGALKGCLGSLDGGCIEKLLVHCGSALESHDVTLAQQVMWVLNNVASPVGDPNQRLTSWFLRALVSRASRVCPSPSPTSMGFNGSSIRVETRLMSVTDLARYVDVIPWHRFGFCAANIAIYKAIERYQKVHILDFSISHCMQWPTLIDALSKRPQGPPSLRITVPSFRPQVPPLLNIPTQQIGLCLTKFANSKNIPFQFNLFPYNHNNNNNNISLFDPSILNLQHDEALVINCQHWLRYVSDDEKDDFINATKRLNPRITVVVDEDFDLTDSSLASRITTCFNYFWIPFDALETFLSKDSTQRLEYEADVGQRIENIIGFEGKQRVERLESCVKVSERMRNGGYLNQPFCDEAADEVKALLAEQASGWGMKREEDALVLTWKGHNAVFVTAWVCSDDEIVVA